MPTKWVLPSKHALLNGNDISRKEARLGVFSVTAVTKYDKLSDLKHTCALTENFVSQKTRHM